VLQFGFLAGYRNSGALTSVTGGIAASSLTLWVTFGPSFVFVFLAAPLVERLQNNRNYPAPYRHYCQRRRRRCNLAVWFAIHTLFKVTLHLGGAGFSFEAPVPSSLDPWALFFTVISAIAFLWLKLSVLRTLAIYGGVSIALHFAISLLAKV